MRSGYGGYGGGAGYLLTVDVDIYYCADISTFKVLGRVSIDYAKWKIIKSLHDYISDPY